MSGAAVSRQEQFSGTKDVAESHKFDEARLADYMAAHVDGYEGPLTVRQFKGGQSNPTYQLVTPSKKYVLRRKPPGTPRRMRSIANIASSRRWARPAFRCRAPIACAKTTASSAACSISWTWSRAG